MDNDNAFSHDTYGTKDIFQQCVVTPGRTARDPVITTLHRMTEDRSWTCVKILTSLTSAAMPRSGHSIALPEAIATSLDPTLSGLQLHPHFALCQHDRSGPFLA